MKRIAIFFNLILSVNLFGQEQPDSSRMEPVEVRAVRANAAAPFAKTNLSRKEIEKQNLGQDLPFLLNQTPSVVVNSDAGNGIGYTGIRIRGTDATRINVTLNGIPYNDAESQGLFFVNLPDFASSVNSVQIQRGVGTSTNGAGAFGATLNFSTNEVNRIAYAEVNNSYGSFNSWKNTIKAGTGLLGDHFTADLRLSRVSSDGYIERASTRLRSFYFSTAYLNDNTDIRLNIFSGKEKTYQAWNGVAEADLKTNRRINYAGTEKPGAPYENETDNYRQDHYQLFFTRRLQKNTSLNAALFLTRGLGYYEQYKADEDYQDYGLPDPVVNGDTTFSADFIRQLWLDNFFYGGIYSFQGQTEKAQYIFGGAVTRYDGIHHGDLTWSSGPLKTPQQWYRHPASKNDFNMYGKWQQKLGAPFQLFVDMQYRMVQYDLEGFPDHPDLSINEEYHFFNPKAGLSFQKHGWQAYASYSIANKEPNRDDFEAGNTEQPKPERLYDLELGLERKTPRTHWSVAFYYMNYRDQLVLTGRINDVGAYTRTNIPKSYRAGIELQGGAQPAEWIRLSANLTLSKNRILDFTEYIDDYDNGGQQTNFYPVTHISFSPDVTAAATVSITPVKDFTVDLLSKYVGSQYLDNTANETRKLDAYFTEDIRAIFSFSKRRLRNISLILQVNNVFNKLYEPNGYTFSYYYNSTLTTENFYFPMAGRNWMVGVNVRM